MTNSKTTRKALLSSALALLMCVAMLIATTFAWFTDTASTSVNKIQAGKLDVELYVANNTTGTEENTSWTKIDSSTDALKFVKAAAAQEGEEVLWEPGCTYSLPALKIVNAGNLALKYKVMFAATDTDANNLKLAEVLDVTMNGRSAGTLYDVLTSTDEDGYAHGELTGGADTGAITLSVKMRESAGNEYQGLKIGGIAITVLATQLESEYDSTGNNYDEGAMYDGYVDPVSAETTKAIIVTSNTSKVSGEQTIGTLADDNMSVTYPNGVTLSDSAASGGTTVSGTQKLEYKGATLSDAASSVTIDATSQAVAQYDLTLPVSEENTTLVTVKIQYADKLTGVKIYHDGTLLPSSDDEGGEYAEYDWETGIIELHLKHASPIDIVYTRDQRRMSTDGEDTYLISSAAELRYFAATVNVDNDYYAGKTIKLTSDIDLGGAEWTPIIMKGGGSGKEITFDGKNHTISNFKVNAATGEKNTGFFGEANWSVIKNLNIDKATVTGINHVGAIVGHGMVTTIESCKVTNSNITAAVWWDPTGDDGKPGWNDGDKAGAIIGYINEYTINIKNCSVSGCTVKGYRDVGGLVGYVGTTGGTPVVTGNSVSNTTITNDRTHNYKSYTEDNQYDVHEIVGEYSGKLDTSNTSTSVITKTIPGNEE